jgi:hypothetical protein
MDPVGQGSFIPKASLAAASRRGGMGLLLLLALMLFAVSIVSAGGAFAYQKILGGVITSKDASLRKAEGAFNPGTIQDLVRTDNRLTQAQVLLQKHVAPSAIFNFLSTITLERVQFTGFEMILNRDGGADISLNGMADSFSSVALQSDQFGSTQLLKDVVVSGISVGDSGKVSFVVNATAVPDLLLYSRNLQAAAPGPQE